MAFILPVFAPKNTLLTFKPLTLWHKTASTPNTPVEFGIYFCLCGFEIDSYASVPDLKRSEGLRVHIVPLLCTEWGKKRKEEDDDDDLTEPTLNDGSLTLKHECMCVCMFIQVHARSVQTKSL